MTHTAKHDGQKRRGSARDESTEPALERFAQLVAERTASLAEDGDRDRFVALVQRALSEARASLADAAAVPPDALPVSRLKASDVVAQGLVAFSQTTLYRAAENGRFYCTMPTGRSIGRVFPAWQFIEPVPELIEGVLMQLANQPSSEIHAFWVTENEALNELSPAEVLAGKPFETRNEVHESQQRILDLPTGLRLRRVQDLAALYSKDMAEIVG